MTNPNCKPLITWNDCDPLGTKTAPPASPQHAPGPPGQIQDPLPPGVIQPKPPPIPHVDGWDMPDMSTVGDAAMTATVCGVVIVAMLVMIVAVASRVPLAPHRLRNFATGSLLLPAASAIAGGSWSVPAVLFWTGASRLTDGEWSGVRMMLALGLPLSGFAATYAWAKFLHKTNTVGLKSLDRTERVRNRSAERRFAAAVRAASNGAPFSVGESIVLGPLAERKSANPLGLWTELTARHQSWMTLPHKEARRHYAIFATTGGGKTELQKRCALGTLDYEWRAWQRWKDVPGMSGRHPRPLLVVISCKGGQDDVDLGIELRAHGLAMGIEADRIALVPFGDRLELWQTMTAREMQAVVIDLLGVGEATTSEGQHFDEMRRRIVSLVVGAPCGPPRSSAEFLDRLNPDKIKDLWGGAPDVVRQVDALQDEKVPQIDDALIRCSNLFDLLQDPNGQMVFDGGRDLADLDMLYVTVPGLDKDAARAQVSAILRMIMQTAGRTAKTQRRSVSLLLDETSALTTSQGALALEDVLERGRSQGVSIGLSAQSPEGVALSAWKLARLLKACAGGILLGYIENAGELCKHFGSIRHMLPTRHLIKGQRHGDEGQVSVGEQWLVDPDRVRKFQTGQFVYAKAGHAQYGQIVPVHTSQLTPLPGTRLADNAARTATTRPVAA
ncbi:hypothetical protein [Nocardia sp. XZ_19_385]|uniref:hypothetical protein n=1 Tax=Nocardia sp. XZ_19_385 TaxID=2769488 RepID=UPI00189021F5|nr:hypothetical protein [Nocardia sp. XZ_19_385]